MARELVPADLADRDGTVRAVAGSRIVFLLVGLGQAIPFERLDIVPRGPDLRAGGTAARLILGTESRTPAAAAEPLERAIRQVQGGVRWSVASVRPKTKPGPEAPRDTPLLAESGRGPRAVAFSLTERLQGP